MRGTLNVPDMYDQEPRMSAQIGMMDIGDGRGIHSGVITYPRLITCAADSPYIYSQYGDERPMYALHITPINMISIRKGNSNSNGIH